MRNCVGEAHWNQSMRIYQQLCTNQDKKRRARQRGRDDHRGECILVPREGKPMPKRSSDSSPDSGSSTSSLTHSSRYSDEDAKKPSKKSKGGVAPVAASLSSCTLDDEKGK